MQVSVIIPTYNRAALVRQAVESVLLQKEPADEIIVVDDGSTDDTRLQLQQFGERINIIHQPNSGVSAARNTGIRHARCEWLAFLDSDDLWKPKKLMMQKRALLSSPEYKICYTDEEWQKNNKRVNPKKVHQKHGGWIYNYCLPRCIISPSSVLVHHSVFEQFGLFDETLPACEDYDLWLRLSCRLPVLLAPQKLIVKRDGPWDQLSHQHSLDKHRIRALVKILQTGSLNEAMQEATRKTLLEKCRIYAMGAEKHGRTDEAQWAQEIAMENRK